MVDVVCIKNLVSFKLSFCIATRNRGGFIGDTLRNIAAQSPDSVEIVVLDGASVDNTEQIVRGLQESIPRLRYFRQEKNGGVDRDYDTAVGLATGEFCWLMSDDDLLKPGAVDTVLTAIEAKVSLIIVNAEVRTYDFSQLLDPDRLRFPYDREYTPADFERLFADTSAYLSYIGAVVIRRDVWMSRQREPFFGSYFIHVGVIFQARLPADTIVLHKPLISIRFGNTIWRPKEFEIRMIRWTELIWSLTAVSESVRSMCYPSKPWRSVKSLLFYRAKGTYDLNDYRLWIRPRISSRWEQFTALSIACFPGVLANIIGLVYCRLDYRDSDIHLLDMKASRFYFRNWFKRPTT